MKKTCAHTGPYADFRPVRGGRVAKRCARCREIERERFHRALATKGLALPSPLTSDLRSPPLLGDRQRSPGGSGARGDGEDELG